MSTTNRTPNQWWQTLTVPLIKKPGCSGSKAGSVARRYHGGHIPLLSPALTSQGFSSSCVSFVIASGCLSFKHHIQHVHAIQEGTAEVPAQIPPTWLPSPRKPVSHLEPSKQMPFTLSLSRPGLGGQPCCKGGQSLLKGERQSWKGPSHCGEDKRGDV